MTDSNYDILGRALRILAAGLDGPVDRIMTHAYTSNWNLQMAVDDARKHGGAPRPVSKTDLQTQLRAITEHGAVFKGILDHSKEALASELRGVRNDWAHNEPITTAQTLRALDTISLLLAAFSDGVRSNQVRTIYDSLQRAVYSSQARNRVSTKTVMTSATHGMSPWREVIRPREEVLSDQFTNAEFAANLQDVAHPHDSQKTPYSDPVEFFRRTYLTQGLKDLLSTAVRRLVGDGGGDPVINLQTNFGGGKTHALLSLWHLFGDTPITELSGDVQDLVAKIDAPTWQPGSVHRAAVVGNYLNVAEPSVKEDGTRINTIWGEIAWQLGGREGYDLVAENDRTGTSPAENFRELLRRYSPCLILIDEWVAYAREIGDNTDLPSGTFDNQFTFAQTLTEAVSSTPGCMLVVSLPASNDEELGGDFGRTALERLQNAIHRQARPWQASERDESFEIVRRRLFEDPDAEAQKKIDFTALVFNRMYRDRKSDFPSSVFTSNYEDRIRMTYPLHPELMDRIYTDWSTREKFQNTRGMLRFMAGVIHTLWQEKDQSPLILPGTLPLRQSLTDINQWLGTSWNAIVDRDIEGPDSAAAAVDSSVQEFGRHSLAERIARTIFLDSAPFYENKGTGGRGVADRQHIWLGTATPDDKNGDLLPALSSLTERSTYLIHQNDGYRYDVVPTLSKTERDEAEQLLSNGTEIDQAISRLIQSIASQHGSMFGKISSEPRDGSDIPDMDSATLIILGIDHAVGSGETRKDDSEQIAWMTSALKSHGTSMRQNVNMLIFLAPDAGLIDSLRHDAAHMLAWGTIPRRNDVTDIQKDEARGNAERYEKYVRRDLRNAYKWIFYPEQADAAAGSWQLAQISFSTSDTRSIVTDVEQKLKHEQILADQVAPKLLYPAFLQPIRFGVGENADESLSVGQLWDYICRFPYLPRLTSESVLEDAVQKAVAIKQDAPAFAIAAGQDAATGHYAGLVLPGYDTVGNATLIVGSETLLVPWDVALQQSLTKPEPPVTPTPSPAPQPSPQPVLPQPTTHPTPASEPAKEKPAPKRYFGQFGINPNDVSGGLMTLNQKVLEELRDNPDVSINVNIEIEATAGNGFSQATVDQVNQFRGDQKRNGITHVGDDNGFAAD